MCHSVRENSGRGLRCVLGLFVLLHSLALVRSLTFDVPFGERKCLSEDLPSETDVRGEVHVSGGRGEMKLDMFVTDQRGNIVFHKMDVNTVKFSFRTGKSAAQYETEAYRFCIVNQVRMRSGARESTAASRRVTMNIDILSSGRQQGTKILAKGEHVAKIQESFTEVTDNINRLIDVMDELRLKEQQLTDVNHSTSRAIVRISVVACLFTIVTGVLQFMSLKSFFKQKKLA